MNRHLNAVLFSSLKLYNFDLNLSRINIITSFDRIILENSRAKCFARLEPLI